MEQKLRRGTENETGRWNWTGTWNQKQQHTQDINRKIEQEEEGRKITTRGVTMKENESMKNNEEEDKNEIAKCN